MGGFFGVASKESCTFDLFFGTDYHSHLGTRRAGMAVYGGNGFSKAIHNIEGSPFRTKFDKDVVKLDGNYGIGCISDFEAQPILMRSHHGSFAITTVSKINNTEEIVNDIQNSAIKVIAVNGNLLDVIDGRVDIHIAEQTLNIKGSDEIDVAEDGTLSIKSISFDKIVQTTQEEIILSGGGAAG